MSIARATHDRLFPALAPIDADDGDLVCLDQAPRPPSVGDPDSDTEACGAAGWPFFAEFIAHDITCERASGDELPRANLDCVYGAGPAGSPFLYQRDDPAKLLIGTNDLGEPADLPRNDEGTALIADPRNDAHLFVSQLHLAMLRVHNAFVGRLRADGMDEHRLIEAAARATRWHYQWVIVNEFLPAAAGPELVEDVISEGPRLFLRDSAPYLPVEFSDGAFRYRDGQIRETYTANGDSGELASVDLIGFRRVPASRAVDWTLMFDSRGAARAQRARRIDGTLAAMPMRLPGGTNGGGARSRRLNPLAVLEAERSEAIGLPPGEEVARAAGERPLSADELGLADDGWPSRTPLPLYFMLESAARADGDRLGPVGGRIVTEVLLGLLDADPGSYRCADPRWRPVLGTRSVFGLADLLGFSASAT